MFNSRNRWRLVMAAGVITAATACAQVTPPLPFPRLPGQQTTSQNASSTVNTQAQAAATATAEPTHVAVAVVATAQPTAGSQAATRPTSTPVALLDPKQLVSVRRGDIVNALQLSGRVAPVNEVQLGFGAKGTINEVAVSPGQPVKAGDVLATLDTHDLQQQLSDAQSALQITTLRLQQLQQQTAAQAQTKQQLAEQQQADAAKQSAINQQKAQDAAAQAQEQLRIAQQGLAQVQAGAAQSDRIAAQQAVVTATGNLDKAQTDLALLQASPTQADVTTAQQGVAAAQIALAKAQADHDKLLLPPDPATVAAAKKDLADAQAALTAFNNPIVVKSADGSSAPKMSDAEKQQRLAAAQLAVTAAQAHLAAVQKAPDPADVQLANMAVDNATADLAAAQQHLATVKAGPTVAQLSAAQNAVQIAQIALTGAQAHQQEVNSHPTPNELADAQSKVAQAQQALDRANQAVQDASNLPLTAPDVSSQSASTASSGSGGQSGDSVQIQTLTLQHTQEQQQSQLQTLQGQLRSSSIRAPFDGIVETVQIHPGDPSDPQKPAMTLAGNGTPFVVADVADSDVASLQSAKAISVQLDPATTATGTFTGIVASPTGSGQLAQIQVQWPGGVPQLGATLQVNVAVDQHRNAVIVPRKAVHAASDRRYVEVLDGSDRKQVDVQVGIVSGDDAEITSGLSEGQIVILPA